VAESVAPMARKPKKRPLNTELAARVRHLVALDAANLMVRITARHDAMVSLFSRLRDRNPLLQTVHSWFLTVDFSELAALEPFEQNAVNQFYSLVGELRWYLQYTEDMPALVRTKVSNFVRRLAEAHLKLTQIIGPPDTDGAPVVEGEVVVEIRPADIVELQGKKK
jgi:hypothetical protein